MNKQRIRKTAALFVVVASATISAMVVVAAEVRVSLEELPAAVRDTMLAEAVGAELTEIERETRHGRVFYEAEFLQDGVEIELRVAADGTLLRRKAERGGVRQEKALQALPEPVRAVILAEAQGAPIRRVEVERHEGVAVYEAEWRSQGQEHEVAVTADGALIESERSMPLADAPVAVQAAVAQAFGAHAPRVVERKMIIVYEAEARIDGREKEILIYPTGRVAGDLDEDDDSDEDDDDDEDDADGDHDD